MGGLEIIAAMLGWLCLMGVRPCRAEEVVMRARGVAILGFPPWCGWLVRLRRWPGR